MKRTLTPARWVTRALAPLALAAVAVTACGSSSSSTSSTLVLTPRVVITSVKGDPRSELVAAMYARVLQDGGFRVSMKDPVALDRAGYYAALQAGDFQLIPEFTHDLETFLYSQPGAPAAPTTAAPSGPASTQAPITVPPLPTTPDTGATTTTPATTAPATTGPATTTTVKPVVKNGRTSAEQIVAIKAALAKTVAVGNGTAAEDKQVIACTPAAVKANSHAQLITLTDLASIAPQITLGGSAAFMADKEFGMPALKNTYGGQFKGTVTVEDTGLADAITNATADCFAISSMNPLVTTAKLTVLDDDQVMIPSNAIVPMLSTTINTSTLVAALDTLNSTLTTARLNQMVNEVVTNGTAPSVVANAFMNTL